MCVRVFARMCVLLYVSENAKNAQLQWLLIMRQLRVFDIYFVFWRVLGWWKEDITRCQVELLSTLLHWPMAIVAELGCTLLAMFLKLSRSHLRPNHLITQLLHKNCNKTVRIYFSLLIPWSYETHHMGCVSLAPDHNTDSCIVPNCETSHVCMAPCALCENGCCSFWRDQLNMIPSTNERKCIRN